MTQKSDTEVVLILTFTPKQIKLWKIECEADWGNENWQDYVMQSTRQLMNDTWGINSAPDDVNMYVEGYVQNLQAENKRLREALSQISQPEPMPIEQVSLNGLSTD